MKRVLVTGASSFVGQSLCSSLLAQGYEVRAAVRNANAMLSTNGLDVFVVGQVGGQTDWSAALVGVDCVIHCVARAHFVRETTPGAMKSYREVNAAGTQRLAEQAAAMDVQRLVFISSIKVNGDRTERGKPFLFSDVPAPEDYYGQSKLEAEQALWVVSAQTSLEVVVVRPPLIYGAGVKGNLLRMMNCLARGVPLPLGGLCNRRSFVGLSNLVDLLLCCINHPAAAGQTFLASDGNDLSTPQLLRLISEGLNLPARLLPMPVGLLQAVGSLAGKRGEIERLVSDLQVDIGYTRERLGWTPPMTVNDGIHEMARWFVNKHGS